MASVHRVEEELRAARPPRSDNREPSVRLLGAGRGWLLLSQNGTTRARLGRPPPQATRGARSHREVLELWLDNNQRHARRSDSSTGQTSRRTGETRHVKNVLTPIRMGDAIVGTLGVNVDVTELKRAEEERLRVLWSLSRERREAPHGRRRRRLGLWSWVAGTDEVRVGGLAARRLRRPAGLTPDSGEAYYALVHPDDRARCAERIARGVARRSLGARVPHRASRRRRALARVAHAHRAHRARRPGARRRVRRHRAQGSRGAPPRRAAASRSSVSSPQASRTTSTTC